MRRCVVALLTALTVLTTAPTALAAGGSIAFTEGVAAGVYTVSPSGGAIDSIGGALLPSFSPDGKQMATVTSAGAILVGNVNGSGRPQLAAYQADVGVRFGPAAWSPDGKQLAYTTNGAVNVVSATGGKSKRIYSPSGFQNEATHPVFSKSGTRVYFIVVNQTLSAAVPYYQVMSVPAGGGTPTAIQPAIPVADPSWALTPFSVSLSPSGNTLAVTLAQRAVPTPGSSADPYSAFAVGLWPVSGNGSVTILPGFSAAAWAPTGAQLCANASSGGLAVIDAGATTLSTPVPAAADPTACAWIP